MARDGELVAAATKGNAEKLHKLITAGANINETDEVSESLTV